MNKHLVFVYGTLRQGGVQTMLNLFPDSKFIGQANVAASLYDLGAHPGLILDEANSLVIGEVYEIDDEILHQLDDYEAGSNYRRRQVEVSLAQQRMSSWIYVPDSQFYSLRRLITSGDWIEYARMKTETA